MTALDVVGAALYSGGAVGALYMAWLQRHGESSGDEGTDHTAVLIFVGIALVLLGFFLNAVT